MARFGRYGGDGKFEDICLDEDCRPTSLVRRFDNIYSDERVDLLDVLEQNGQAQGHGADLEQCRTAEFSTRTRQQPEQHLPVSIVVVSSICFLMIVIMNS